MPKTIAVHQGVIGPALVEKLASFRAADTPLSTYYLTFKSPQWDGLQAMRLAVKNALVDAWKRIDELHAHPAVHDTLRRDWVVVDAVAPKAIGERYTAALACFVSSSQHFGLTVRIPWPIRNRTFFTDQFVVWPLEQLLCQADHYVVCLTDKDEGRLLRFHMEQIEEVAAIVDEIPGRVRVPDPYRELGYRHKHVEHYHRHFENVAARALALFEQEPFEHLIIGGLWETLPQFEERLHRYLRDRIAARWDLDVHTPLAKLQDRTIDEERSYLNRLAADTWRRIQDRPPGRRSLGAAEVCTALWQRSVDTLVVHPDVSGSGARCTVCGRLQPENGPCVECRGPTAEVADMFEEAVHDSVEQSGRVLYWKDETLKQAHSIAALRRF